MWAAEKIRTYVQCWPEEQEHQDTDSPPFYPRARNKRRVHYDIVTPDHSHILLRGEEDEDVNSGTDCGGSSVTPYKNVRDMNEPFRVSISSLKEFQNVKELNTFGLFVLMET